MKKIRTKGITYLENLDTSSEWYLGTDYTCGDLYEAEEVNIRAFPAGELIEKIDGTVISLPNGEKWILT